MANYTALKDNNTTTPIAVTGEYTVNTAKYKTKNTAIGDIARSPCRVDIRSSNSILCAKLLQFYASDTFRGGFCGRFWLSFSVL